MNVQEFMKDAVALYLGKGNILLYGKKGYISTDRAVVPYKKNNLIMIPVEFFLESINCENLEKEKSILLERADIISEVGPGGKDYISLETLCALYGWYLHIEENGIVIYSRYNMESELNWSVNMKMMRKVSESYMFDDVDGLTIYEMVKKKHPDYNHPRLILTEDKIAEMRKEIHESTGDIVYKKLFQDLKAYADQYLEERTSGYEIRDGIRLLYVCRENSPRMLCCALMYLITGDEEYAERAYLEMYTSACFVDWNPYHFLDVGEMALALGLAYDWLYQWMSERQRKYIREAIVKNGIYAIMEDFQDKPRKRSWNWRGDVADNWRMVIAGVGVAALAIVDELDGEELEFAQQVIEQTLIDIRGSLGLFAPLGAYEEGCSYWGYTMEYFAYYINSLRTAAGSDFGYIDVPGMRLTNRYMMAVNGSVSIFNYHDCGALKSNIPPHMMFLAEYFKNYSEALPRIRKIMTEVSPAYKLVNDLLYYNPLFLKAANEEFANDICLPVSEIATMRTGWNTDDMYLGFHCDDPMGGDGHDHMDAGTFVLDSQGENFIIDLGNEGYNIPNYNQCYRIRAEGHNTVIFNPEAEYAQKWGGSARIIDHAFTVDRGYAIGDLTNAYPEKHGVKSYHRCVQMDKKKREVTIEDNISLSKPTDVWWFAHTRANIEIAEDGKSAILNQNGKRLLFTIIMGEDASFEIMEAKPLPTSPIIEEQTINVGVHKLVIHILAHGNVRIAVKIADYYME